MSDDSNRTYIAIDLKSFYASVECADRGLDPLGVNLVVADAARTEKTICLAVSPALKAYGIPGRARLFEVNQKVREINAARRRANGGRPFSGKSRLDAELKADPSLELDFIIAPPRMAKYMELSTRIYDIYTDFIAPEDIHVYSIDEVFIDATTYLKTYKLSPRELTMRLVNAVLEETGITATAGIGSNLFLCKIAMDITAKHMPPDVNGVRIAELDEMSFRRELWDHRPLTDFWRIGRGISQKLEANGMFTLGDVARRSTYDEESLYRLFGVNAELIIDHAWGWEPCTIPEIKSYRPENNSLSSGQVLPQAYNYEMGRLVLKEMADLMALDIFGKRLVTDQLVLTVCYDTQNLSDPLRRVEYRGPVTADFYGRPVPKHAHGTENLPRPSSSCMQIGAAFVRLYDRIADKNLLIRRLYLGANHVVPESSLPPEEESFDQLDLFTDYEELQRRREAEKLALEKERRRQESILDIQRKYGKNAILKGMNLAEGATTVARNGQVGGHKA